MKTKSESPAKKYVHPLYVALHPRWITLDLTMSSPLLTSVFLTMMKVVKKLLWF